MFFYSAREKLTKQRKRVDESSKHDEFFEGLEKPNRQWSTPGIEATFLSIFHRIIGGFETTRIMSICSFKCRLTIGATTFNAIKQSISLHLDYWRLLLAPSFSDNILIDVKDIRFILFILFDNSVGAYDGKASLSSDVVAC